MPRASAFAALRSLEGPLEMREHLPSEIGQVRQRPLAAEQQAVKFLLQLLDSTREGWLSDVALLSRAREVQRSRHRKKVANLMHFHRATSSKRTLSGAKVDPLVTNCCWAWLGPRASAAQNAVLTT
jgi:hypothetical protein